MTVSKDGDSTDTNRDLRKFTSKISRSEWNIVQVDSAVTSPSSQVSGVPLEGAAVMGRAEITSSIMSPSPSTVTEPHIFAAPATGIYTGQLILNE